ncbi:hypothetical protein [Bradyrhizobium sp. CB3481]|uniref:hypothetical protein n=1 Tax=Bradyrhizobium sp. CB3481 TaxID=3039158 RepID=UPI0024B0C6FA|nr:hypothetical protein [Bradyrhizobium sp. CB3481]WFU14927.1 hypothetical protein QA643_28640 [Bradyrhizobium sp. CB3481]
MKAPLVPWTSRGFYFGGGSGITHVADPYGPSIYDDDIRAPKALIGGQLGYNLQHAGSPWVFGLQANLSAVDADGTNTCLAYSGPASGRMRWAPLPAGSARPSGLPVTRWPTERRRRVSGKSSSMPTKLLQWPDALLCSGDGQSASVSSTLWHRPGR